MQSKLKSETLPVSTRGLRALLCLAGVLGLLASASVAIAETRAELMLQARAAAAASRVAADEATAAAAEARALADAAVGIVAADLMPEDPTPTSLPAEAMTAPAVEGAAEPVGELTADDLLEELPQAPVATTAY
jgi:hypothetical protein